MNLRISIVSLIPVLILFWGHLAQSESIKKSNIPNNNTEKEVKIALHNLKADLNKKSEVERKLRAELYLIDQSIKNLAAKVSHADQQLMATNLKAQSIAREIIEIEDQIKKHQRKIMYHLRLSKHLETRKKLTLLASARSLNESQKIIQQLKILSANEAEHVKGLAAAQQKLQDKKNELEMASKDLILRRKELSEKESNLKSDQETKIALIQRANELKIDIGKKIGKLRGAATSSFDEVKSFYELKGSLPWPVEGKVDISYGINYLKPYNLPFASKGIKIRPHKSLSVRAIADGQVVYDGFLKGFGRTIILDHGDQYFSIYSGLQEGILFKSFKSVSQGEAISSVSDQLSPMGPGLYFEMRHYSESIDPISWLRKVDGPDKILYSAAEKQ